MMRILTNRDIRRIYRVLTDAGMDCAIGTNRDNAVTLEIVCERNMTWGNGRNIIDTACFLIRNVCDDIIIRFVSGEDVGNDLHLVLLVGYEGRALA